MLVPPMGQLITKSDADPFADPMPRNPQSCLPSDLGKSVLSEPMCEELVEQTYSAHVTQKPLPPCDPLLPPRFNKLNSSNI